MNIDNYFKHYSIVNPEQQTNYDFVNKKCLDLAKFIESNKGTATLEELMSPVNALIDTVSTVLPLEDHCAAWALEELDTLKSDLVYATDLSTVNVTAIILGVKMYLNLGITLKAHEDSINT